MGFLTGKKYKGPLGGLKKMADRYQYGGLNGVRLDLAKSAQKKRQERQNLKEYREFRNRVNGNALKLFKSKSK